MKWVEPRLAGSLFFRHIDYFLSNKSQQTFAIVSVSTLMFVFFAVFFCQVSQHSSRPFLTPALDWIVVAPLKFTFTLFLAQTFKVWDDHFGRHFWLVSAKTEKAHGCASLPFLANFNFTGSVFEWPFETVHTAGGGRAQKFQVRDGGGI